MKGHVMTKTSFLHRTIRAAFALLVVCAAPAVSAAGATRATSAAGATAPPAAAAVPDQYRIGAGDTIHITVYQSPDLSLDAHVNEAGDISYPLLGRVQLGGLTVNGAEARLAQALKKGEIVKDPQITITVINVRANQV
ncbi:MAG: polysaccharide biosynthesis/export family protein, partial [Burkholderiales bacterium]|nr:polysaccharide biosynthesis/export family protein [Burkholderiales bacterium]